MEFLRNASNTILFSYHLNRGIRPYFYTYYPEVADDLFEQHVVSVFLDDGKYHRNLKKDYLTFSNKTSQ